MRKVASAIAAVLVALVVLPAPGTAAPSAALRPASDVRHFDADRSRELVASPADIREAKALGTDAAATPAVGEQRIWLALDDAEGALYPKLYTLRGIGEHIEVWVASDEDEISTGTNFPGEDCRNDRVEITDEQVNYLIEQFDTVMYPIESEAFSVPPSRNGKNAPLTDILELPSNYYRGDGDRIVTLIDNVRDDNFYDTDNEHSLTYIAGFYWNLFDDYFNRLVMTIDAFDWLHRTGANPPNAPSEDPCLNATARPHLYEGVFAHEYQHLLENYVDFDETSWVNEGLSDYAQTIVEYVDGTLDVNTIGFDSHIQCFLGYNNTETPANPIPREGGPENSLTRWGDQEDYEAETLCDYGAAYTFMLYLYDRFGEEFLRALHLDEANGLDSLSRLLKAEDPTLTAGIVIQRWALMVAVDKALDAGWDLVGADAEAIQTSTLNADINWDNDQAYEEPGAPPNGSDYVRFRDATDAYLAVNEVTSIEFDGASELPALPLEWRVDRRPPKGSDGAALYSGKGDNLDHAMAFEARVPRNGASLEFDTWYRTDAGYDWAYVQVSDDGGDSFRSIRCSGTNVDGALGPAYEGRSGGWVHETCNLRRYAGENVVISFRYVTDGGVVFDGFWVDNISVGNDVVSTGRSLRPFDSPTQINPVDVQKFVVQIVAFDEVGEVVHVFELPLDDNFDASLTDTALTDAIGTAGGTVAAIVTYLDRTEEVQQEAPYTLTVNGVVQPGGGGGQA
ncbi:MAG TPA: peptidase M6 [Actinomycetota bacterium]|nr:peptidase M6 [Actinomycetota bacterium]